MRGSRPYGTEPDKKQAMNVPQLEMEKMERRICAHLEFIDPEFVITAYRSYGLDVIPDPFSADTLLPIKRAQPYPTLNEVIQTFRGDRRGWSGFDILDGTVTRPMHGKLGLDDPCYKM